MDLEDQNEEFKTDIVAPKSPAPRSYEGTDNPEEEEEEQEWPQWTGLDLYSSEDKPIPLKSVTFSCENEYITFPDRPMLEMLSKEEMTIEQALFTSKACNWRNCRTPIILIILVLLSLIMSTLVFILIFLKCFSSCPFKWQKFQEKCYYYSSHKEADSWNNAQNRCHDLDANLVVISSTKEQDFLVNNMNHSDTYWIGFRSIETEGMWKWVDDTDSSYTYWHDRKSNNNKERCAVLDKNLNYRWKDEKCSLYYAFICEKNIQKVCVYNFLGPFERI